MLDMIKKVLCEHDVSAWLVTETVTESMELYFIRRNLDMRRQTRVYTCDVTVYHDFEEGGKKYRGSAAAAILDGMSEQEIAQKIRDAYESASYAKNEWYPLPKPETSGTAGQESQQGCPQIAGQPVNSGDTSAGQPSGTNRQPNGYAGSAACNWQSAAMELAAAVFEADCQESAFLNSLEVFSKKKDVRLLNSEGVDVSWTTYALDGEFVAQALDPQDVESYEDFHYRLLDRDAIRQKAAEVLERTKDRAAAFRTVPAGTYRVILSGKHVDTVMNYYPDRSYSNMIYMGYSSYKVGDNVQMAGSEAPIEGDRLNITLSATEPYSTEGIPMKDHALLKDGCLQLIPGSSRFCHYLGVEPTGVYKKICVEPGTVTFEEMKQTPYLYVAAFSDFQMDEMTGNFGGEIRLAYLFDGETVTPVTGGSINGNIVEAQKHMRLSKETQETTTFAGPYAISLEGVTVAGA